MTALFPHCDTVSKGEGRVRGAGGVSIARGACLVIKISLCSKSTCLVVGPIDTKNLETWQETLIGQPVSEIPPNPPLRKGGRGDFWKARAHGKS